jgi:hypothetical protein
LKRQPVTQVTFGVVETGFGDSVERLSVKVDDRFYDVIQGNNDGLWRVLAA